MSDLTEAWIIVGMLAVYASFVTWQMIVSVEQRDDARHLLWSVRYFTYHRDRMPAEQRVKLIKDALEGKVLYNKEAYEVPEGCGE